LKRGLYKDLERVIGYRFRDKSLLEMAVTHPSFRFENADVTCDNQRLEFLGDAVLDLLLGLWRPQSGTIRYGDVPHDELNYLSLRSSVAYVSQETTLFDGTLRENLSLGKPGATDAELIDVCRLVYLDKLMESLPAGLDTVVGENGVRLSGGERQRLAIGRALILDPDVLILDEATSSLDLNAERMIKQTIHDIHGKLTLLIVTHRINAVTDADMIHVLEGGAIRESGSYTELLKQGGLFSYLCSLQSGLSEGMHTPAK